MKGHVEIVRIAFLIIFTPNAIALEILSIVVIMRVRNNYVLAKNPENLVTTIVRPHHAAVTTKRYGGVVRIAFLILFRPNMATLDMRVALHHYYYGNPK